MNAQSKVWIVASLIAVFTLGIAAGFFGERLLIHKRGEGRHERREKGRHFPTLETMSGELELTRAQQDAIREIFRRNEDRLKTFGTEIHKRLGEIRSRLKSEIDGLLTPEQKIRFESMIESYGAGRERPSHEKAKDHSR